MPQTTERSLDIHIAAAHEELEQCRRIRRVVFIEGQGVDEHLEMDGRDDEATHVVARLGDAIVGCARLRMIAGRAKLERIAVLPDHRGRGIGRAILSFLVEEARRRGAREVFMHGQTHALTFYERCGFIRRGEPFLEAGIEHVELVWKR